MSTVLHLLRIEERKIDNTNDLPVGFYFTENRKVQIELTVVRIADHKINKLDLLITSIVSFVCFFIVFLFSLNDLYNVAGDMLNRTGVAWSALRTYKAEMEKGVDVADIMPVVDEAEKELEGIIMLLLFYFYF